MFNPVKCELLRLLNRECQLNVQGQQNMKSNYQSHNNLPLTHSKDLPKLPLGGSAFLYLQNKINKALLSLLSAFAEFFFQQQENKNGVKT